MYTGTLSFIRNLFVGIMTHSAFVICQQQSNKCTRIDVFYLIKHQRSSIIADTSLFVPTCINISNHEIV